MIEDIVSKLEAQYGEDENHFVFETNKELVILRLRQIESFIEALPDFDHFPEGATGALIYTMLRLDSYECPDAGDFNYVLQGYEKILRVSHGVIAEETFDW